MLTKDEQKTAVAHNCSIDDVQKDDPKNGQNRENTNLDDVLLGKRVKR